MTLNNAKVTGNSGEGIWNVGKLTLNNSTVSGNIAYGNSVGGIDNSGTLTLNNSTVSDNSAGIGGGIYNSGTLTMNNSTVSGNRANYFDYYNYYYEPAIGGGLGGGIYNAGTATITGSTVSDNHSDGYGGGIYNDGTLMLRNSTVSDNETGYGSGEGIYNAHTATIGGTIVSNDVVGAFTSLGYNMIRDTTGANGFSPDLGDLLNVDPMLGQLADNGGPTWTHALLPGSPAIDAGDPEAVPGENGVPLYDQRGEPFARVDALRGRIDIGAFEYLDPNLLVDTLADESDGNYTRGDLSLREAIELSNNYRGPDTIRFDPALTAAGSATILLKQGELAITDDVTIEGPGTPPLTIDASGNDVTPENNGRGSGVFNIDDGAASVVDVTISGLTLSGGDVVAGGAIRNVEDLTLTASTLTGNFAITGGGIYNTGTLTLTASALTHNISGNGGGISNAGTLTLNDSTVSGNTTIGGGGGISNTGTLTLRYSTVSHNGIIFGGGGGIRNAGTVTISNTIVAGNRVVGANPTDVNGVFTSLGYNLIGDTDGGGGFRTDLGDLLNVDPRLGPLADNGGPTWTHALLPGSPAIDAGDPAASGDYDQRGPGFARVVGGRIDIGAFELQSPQFVTGDVNRDGQRTTADISALMAALTDLTTYQTASGLTHVQMLQVCDTNRDNMVTNADLQGLISLLANSGDEETRSIATVGAAATAGLAPALVEGVATSAQLSSHAGSGQFVVTWSPTVAALARSPDLAIARPQGLPLRTTIRVDGPAAIDNSPRAAQRSLGLIDQAMTVFRGHRHARCPLPGEPGIDQIDQIFASWP